MSSRISISFYMIAGLSLVTMALSAFAFTQELSHFTAGGMSDEERIAAFISGDRVPGLSSQTQMSFMLDCRNAIVSPVGLALAEDERSRLYSACLSAARSVAAADPASSLAWFSGAQAALALGDYDLMNQLMAKSYSAGKNEGWVAKLRAELVELNFDRFDKALLPQHEADLALLVASYDMPAVATLYARTPGSRDRITDAAEALPEAKKGAFLRNVQRAMAEAGT